MATICPKCNSKNIKRVARRMKTKYGRVTRKLRCENCGHAWAEESHRTSRRVRSNSPIEVSILSRL